MLIFFLTFVDRKSTSCKIVMAVSITFKLSSYHKRLLNLAIIACISAMLKDYSNKHLSSIRVTTLRLLPNNRRYKYLSILKAPHIHKDARNAFSMSKYTTLLKISFLLGNLDTTVRCDNSIYHQYLISHNIKKNRGTKDWHLLRMIMSCHASTAIRVFSNIPYAHTTATLQTFGI